MRIHVATCRDVSKLHLLKHTPLSLPYKCIMKKICTCMIIFLPPPPTPTHIFVNFSRKIIIEIINVYISKCIDVSDQQTSIYELYQNAYNHIGTCLKNCLVVKNIMIKINLNLR